MAASHSPLPPLTALAFCAFLIQAVYLLLEYVPGGELSSILQTAKFLVEPVASFYTACITSALEHMHDRQIVYRDLKPSNILIDGDGYVKVVDFGLAKLGSSKTFTLCGTPEYLAPEIISNVGHTLAVDWWALGVIVFELLVGRPPFVAEKDPMSIYKQILAAKLPPPRKGAPSLSRDSLSFVRQLCLKQPSNRLGCRRRGAEDVRCHPFLARINRRRLEKKLLQPPCIPQLTGPLDASAFAVLASPPYQASDFVSELTLEVQDQFYEW